MTLDQILTELLKRRVGERAIRMSTPLSQGKKDEVPTPKAKSYETSFSSKLPILNSFRSDDSSPSPTSLSSRSSKSNSIEENKQPNNTSLVLPTINHDDKEGRKVVNAASESDTSSQDSV